MRLLIYSDVHGNLPAFEQMIKDAGDCDSYICLGDLVNYGPWSNECVDLALSLPQAVAIMGNHEEAYLNGFYPGENNLVQSFFNQTFPLFQRQDLIKNFLPDFIAGDFLCTHTIQNSYVYPDTQVQLDRNYIIGHSHHQFRYENNGSLLFNAGSVGQNRKYINVANYLIYETDSNDISMKHTIFDINLVVEKMKFLNYPENCIDYYLKKERL